MMKAILRLTYLSSFIRIGNMKHLLFYMYIAVLVLGAGGLRADDAFPGNAAVKIVKLSFASLQQTAAMLTEIKSPEGKVAVNEEAHSLVLMDGPDRIRMMEALIAQIDIQILTAEIPLKFSRADEVLDRVRPMLTRSVGIITADMIANTIKVTDSPAVVDKVRRAVEALDPRGRKVILEAKLVHVVLDDQHLDGVDWSGIVADHQHFRLGGQYLFLGGKEKTLSLGTIEAVDFVPLIEALDTVGVVKEYPVVDVPVMSDSDVWLKVQFNEPDLALEVVGDNDIPVVTGTAIEFFIKPRVDTDGTLKTMIYERDSSGVAEVQGAAGGSIFSRKARYASVRSIDGGAIVIGGIVATEQVLTRRKVPLMGDIPLLGLAFRYHNSSLRREEFVVFLTPKIIVPEAVAAGEILAEQVQ